MRDADRRHGPSPRRTIGDLSGSDALLLLEAIEACVRTDDESDFRTTIWPKLAELFDFRYAYASTAFGSTGPDHRNITLQRCVNYNVPRDTCIAYNECGWETKDLVIEEHFRSFQPQYWSGGEHRQLLLEDGETRTIPTTNPCCALLLDYGIRSGYLCGLPSTSPSEPSSILCFSSSEEHTYDPRVDRILHLLAPHMHAALLRVTRHDAVDDLAVNLSGRECQVLEWLKEGKSSWDISMVLGVSERTINFHVYNLLRKLGAINRPQAVAIAMRRGLISLD
jgi:DNA-binding CsgD family transcriptional regulator